jgi:HK97 gp10 family phage protein
MGVTLKGFRELEEVLSNLPKATGKNVLRRVAKGALLPMAAKARQLAPSDQGDLRESITVSEKRTRRAKIGGAKFAGSIGGKASFRSSASTGITMAMGPSAGKGVLAYATFVEFGTIDTRAFPFMRPAWQSGKQPALVHVIMHLETEILKATKKRALKASRA